MCVCICLYAGPSKVSRLSPLMVSRLSPLCRALLRAIWCYIRALAPRKTLEKSKTNPPQIHFPRWKQCFFDFLLFLLHFLPKMLSNHFLRESPSPSGGGWTRKNTKISSFSHVFTDFHASVCTYMCVCTYVCMQGPLLLQTPGKIYKKAAKNTNQALLQGFCWILFFL